MENFVADGIYIDAPPQRVFEALYEPEEVLEWMMATEARIAPGERGEYTVTCDDGSVVSGTISSFRPGEELVIREVFWSSARMSIAVGTQACQFEVGRRIDASP
ncbi:MAG: SRPBCC domain-containing protein [Planctomycetota bacterium]